MTISLRRFRSAPLAALVLVVCAFAFAIPSHAQNQSQQGAPNVGFVYPAGGQRGTTFTVSVGGQRLREPVAAHFSGAGLHAKVLGYERPLTVMEFNKMRDEMQALQKKRVAAYAAAPKEAGRKGPTGIPAGWSAAEEKSLAELRVKTARRPNRQAPALAETVTLEVTIPADAAPGPREFRLQTATGLSNPFVFHVGELPEFTASAVIGTVVHRPPAADTATPPPFAITLPVTVNGQILAGEIDRFRFAARAGQRIVVAVQARALIPYLADAVPGWFQATLALFDDAGRELAYRDDFRFNPDPVLAFEIPADGFYTIAIKDSIYRGREDFVYRIALGELPFITGIFPLGAAPAERAKFELRGWNLGANTLAVRTDDKPPGTFTLFVRRDGHVSNSVRFAVNTQPDGPEVEPNNDSAQAHALAFPAIVNGRIASAGDEDVFRFTGRAGDRVIAEVFARRLDSTLDSILQLSDATGAILATNDDHEDPAAGLSTHHADSRIDVTLPTDGDYFLRLREAQHRGGEEYSYRLHLRAPAPDFELRVVPSSINVRTGDHARLTVYAVRRDGFDGEISLGLVDPPSGVGISGARIPAGADRVHLTVGAASGISSGPLSLTLAGRADLNGRAELRVATPAEDMMQAFFYRHLVPSRQLLLLASGRGVGLRTSPASVQLPIGGTTRVTVTGNGAREGDNFLVELLDPPAGITIQKIIPGRKSVEVILACAAPAKSGARGNLILNVSAERPGKGKTTRRVPLGCAPAVPFEIVEKSAAAKR